MSNPGSDKSEEPIPIPIPSPSPSPSRDVSKSCGLDLSLVLPSAQDFRDGKFRSEERTAASPATDSLESSPSGVPLESCKMGNGDDKNLNSVCDSNCTNEKSLSKPEEATPNKIIPSKGSKKWMGPNESCCGFKSIFKPENSDASLLVEAAISAAEKDIVPFRYDKEHTSEETESGRTEAYSVNQYGKNSPCPIAYEDDKPVEYEKRFPEDSPKPPRRIFQSGEKSNFNDVLKCNTLLKISTSPLHEIPKDYVRDPDAETFNDIEIHDYRSRDLAETYKESDAFHDQYRIHDFYRNDKPDYSEEFRPSSADKYREADSSADCYMRNLEKYRNVDVYRLRSEIYDFGATYRDPSEERDGQVQNLCLKEKSLQYETLEELARIGRDNPGK